MIKLLLGDSAEILKTLEDNSVDSVVTDPPSGINFMGKEWDHNKGGRQQWVAWLSSIFIEVYRILKPGGHCLVWALPRTSHWTGTALEDAGFEIRDRIFNLISANNVYDNFINSLDVDQQKMWGLILESISPSEIEHIFGTGFPKSFNAGEGQGTALKPAVECWWLVRKPISEKTIVENVLKHGTGGMNIEMCRIPLQETGEDSRLGGKGTWSTQNAGWVVSGSKRERVGSSKKGRFPANLIHDGSEEVLSYFPNAGGQRGDLTNHTRVIKSPNGIYGMLPPRFDAIAREENDKSAARFFYCSKPSQTERNFGCNDLEEKFDSSRPWCTEESDRGRIATRMVSRTGKNNHPTVKSIRLMSYLCKLITPKGGIILDCFMGSGTTGCAAKINGFSFIGIEKEEPSYNIAQARIKAYTVGKVTPPKVKKVTEPKVETTTGTVQNTLFE
jgi:site-specific DNA-methyltransferase (adenine-specific)